MRPSLHHYVHVSGSTSHDGGSLAGLAVLLLVLYRTRSMWVPKVRPYLPAGWQAKIGPTGDDMGPPALSHPLTDVGALPGTTLAGPAEPVPVVPAQPMPAMTAVPTMTILPGK